MRQCLGEEQTTSGDALHYNTRGRNATLRRGGIKAGAGVLFCLLLAWSVPWYGVATHSTAAGMEWGTRGGAYLLAVGIGTLSWLVAVVIVAALLLGGILLLNALVQQYWPQDGRQTLDSVPPETATAAAVAPEDQQRGSAVGVNMTQRRRKYYPYSV
jgi:hypothetical protein